MTIQTTAHLNFRGDARAALEFYRSVFGGDLRVSTYGDLGMPEEFPDARKVVFGRLAADDGFAVMAYDIPGESAGSIAGGGSTRREGQTTITDQAMFLSISAETLAELSPYWDALRAGATVVAPLSASAWSPGFGMLTDRFGVTWSCSVATE
ncbi:VOC family protein [Leucobacter chromiiresistens]|uniref:Glyoxalase/bleomycin resistance protein/dioxygenase n=1 Tax=Leucobacter chromiiresistens TaxID=1079994 RepID=A0A147EDY0_9MICO|nr:VOC family protein [Leucobacter chromiiresistens]KTR82623.1 glyoxalase/bleomycin resistance protein/dioxygenase [Leucobacter chromiiresistens]